MAGARRTAAVSRAEFYSTVALLFLLPAILFLAVGFPDSLLRQIAAGLVFVAMIGMSVTYSILAIRERGRRTNGDPGGEPSAATDRPRE